MNADEHGLKTNPVLALAERSVERRGSMGDLPMHPPHVGNGRGTAKCQVSDNLTFEEVAVDASLREFVTATPFLVTDAKEHLVAQRADTPTGRTRSYAFVW
jgi:hypothetical protein